MTNNKSHVDSHNDISTGASRREPFQNQSELWLEAQNTIEDIDNTFGFIPEFINSITDQAITGVWNEIKNLYFNPRTALDLKTKDLINLGVATQIPCDFMGYFQQISSLSNGASLQEQSEAILVAAITRHWSAVLNGFQMDKDEFKKEIEKINSETAKTLEDTNAPLLPEEIYRVHFFHAKETYLDIEKTLGFVPQFFTLFPEEGIGGAWSEFKGVLLNPYTALRGLHKELICLAVAAQIPCDYSIYFHRTAARVQGATNREIQEAIALAALTRHWSAIFHGSQMDLERFKREIEQIVQSEDLLHLDS